MKRRNRLLGLCGAVLALAAVFWWQRGGPHDSANLAAEQRQPENAAAQIAGGNAPQQTSSAIQLESSGRPVSAPDAAQAPSVTVKPDPRFPHRLSNTPLTLTQLASSDQAVLLRNALIDTKNHAPLPIPAHLRATDEPGSYVAQAKGAVGPAFRAALAAANAEIVSYIPNNAFLVKADSNAARRLSADARVQAVFPLEPYFKLEEPLLALAVDQQPLPENTLLNVVVFPGVRNEAEAEILQLGAVVVREQPTPFGTELTIRPPAESLAALARLPQVQSLELARERVSANDLSRVTVAVSPDPVTASPAGNYLGLTGSGVLVNVNDSGVDESHPALSGRVVGVTTDNDGHGTHVAGSIAGNGAKSDTVIFASGSTNDPNAIDMYRGMAPAATIFSQHSLLNFITDAQMQQAAARTNALISNNSWNYFTAYNYNFSSASFDAAVRDALPGTPGEQPLLFVFSAGNAGDSDSSGQGGSPGTVLAPATAKNVLTIGGLEQLRLITNEVTRLGQTNRIWVTRTDSSLEVMVESSRGNVSPGQEGDFGRFKPDVVAPGTFVISCKANGWQSPTNLGGGSVSVLPNITIPAGATNEYSIFVPSDGQQLSIRVVPNQSSPNPMPNLPIFVKRGTNTTPADYKGAKFAIVGVTPPAETYYYAIGNPGLYPVTFDIQINIGTALDDIVDYLNELRNLNDGLGDWYRYETGTSMSAAMVSGVLALMQEYYQQRLGRTNSPALMKALVINGARSLPDYDLSTKNIVNHQGWGLLDITNSLPADLSGIFDQNPTNTLATGESHTKYLTLSGQAQVQPLRITLVWTDPPGNPLTSIKLVNDLDLVVTNLTTGEVYVGNHFEAGSDFTTAGIATNATGTNIVVTNALPVADFVNNVENVFIREPRGGSFSVTVIGRRVNVNAVTVNTNDIGQDYAMVISSGNGPGTAAFTVSDGPFNYDPLPLVTVITNGQALLKERIGANPPLLVSTNGATNQWRFYVFTNAPVGTNAIGTNLAFLTFIPPNLSRARNVDADIDLYVTTNPAITNLDANALLAADKSLKRGGNESIIYTNAPVNQVYYVGVKAEDQQAAEFGLFASSSDNPFSQRDDEGNLIVRAISANVEVPDGLPEDPQAGLVFAIATEPVTIRRLVVTNVITHENLGDLIGNLSHQDGLTGQEKWVVLNDHTFGDNTVPPSPVTYTFVYEDNDEGDIMGSRPTDGPGSLLDFVGDEGQGVWMLTMVDNALHHTGTVDNLSIRIEPALDLTNQLGYTYGYYNVQPDSFFYQPVTVPPGVTNLSITVAPVGDSVPLEVYVRRSLPPTRTQYDKYAIINPPGGEMTLSIYDSPPLTPGRWIIGVYNPNSSLVQVRLGVFLGRNLNATPFRAFVPNNVADIVDDTVTNSSVFVPIDMQVADVMVDVRIDHPRAADLVLHLVSPSGTRVLLAENRGGPFATNYGSGYLTTNYYSGVTNQGGWQPHTNMLSSTQTVGTVRIDYEFIGIPDEVSVFYDGQLIFQSGLISGAGLLDVDYGPGTDTNVFIVMNRNPNPDTRTAWEYTPTLMSGRYYFVTFTDDTNLTQVPIKFQPPPLDPAQLVGTNGLAPTNRLFVLPEEPMSRLMGETAYGLWSLQVWDNLAGNPATNAQVVRWQLNLAFVNTNAPATSLTNGVATTNSVVGGQTVYFAVDVPASAVFATNTLTTINGSGSLDLLFNQLGIPDTNMTPGTIILLNNVNSGVSVLDSEGKSNPTIIPGLRYYLGVRNNTPDTTNTFTLQVDFDIPKLNPNGPPEAYSVASNALAFFEVDIPTNALSVTFELLNLGGNMDLFVSRAPSVPSPTSYQYASTDVGTNDEQIVITNVVVAGKWNIAVYNNETYATNFEIRVSYSGGGFSSYLYGGKILSFAAPPAVSGGEVTLTFGAVIGQTYRVQASSDLLEWTDIATVTAQRVTVPVRDPAPATRHRFYRLISVE